MCSRVEAVQEITLIQNIAWGIRRRTVCSSALPSMICLP